MISISVYNVVAKLLDPSSLAITGWMLAIGFLRINVMHLSKTGLE